MNFNSPGAAQPNDSQEGRLAHGAELIGEVVQYENSYRLCHLRSPEGIMIALAEQIG